MKKSKHYKDGNYKSRFVSKYGESRVGNLSANTLSNKRTLKSKECESSDTDSDDFLKLVSTSSKKCKSLSAFSSSDSENDVSPKKEKLSEDNSRNYVDSREASDEESNLSVGELEDESEVIGILYIEVL